MKENGEQSIRTIIRRASDRALQSFASETCMTDEEDSQDLDHYNYNELIIPLKEISKTITSKASDVWQNVGTTRTSQDRMIDTIVHKGAPCSSKKILKNKGEKPIHANQQYPPKCTEQKEQSNIYECRVKCIERGSNKMKKRLSMEKRSSAILKDKNGYRWTDLVDSSDIPSRYENIRNVHFD